MTFCHYIITRFNLPLSSRKDGDKDVCGKEYLSYRSDLFERFCMPSVVNQSCQDFRWLILFDINTPEEFKQRAEGWHNIYPNLIPCYLDTSKYGDLKDHGDPVFDVENDGPMLRITERFVTEIIRSMEETMPEWVLTTRLDNDDALHREFVSFIQTRFSFHPERKEYDLVYSYKYVPDEKIVYRYPLKNGHFMTLAEQGDSAFRSVMFCNHLEMDKYVRAEHIYARPLQTELIHGGNVVNGYTDLSISGLWYALLRFRRRDFAYETADYSRLKALWMIGSLVKHRIIRKWEN